MNGWEKTPSKQAVAARILLSVLMAVGSIVRNAAIASKFVRLEHCSTELIVTRRGPGSWRKQFPPAAIVRTDARCRWVRAPVSSCASLHVIVTLMDTTA